MRRRTFFFDPADPQFDGAYPEDDEEAYERYCDERTDDALMDKYD